MSPLRSRATTLTRRLRATSVGANVLIPCVAAVLSGCASTAGGHVLGAKPSGDPIAVRDVRKIADKAPVVVRGELVTKCPTAGCWFDIRDGGETIRVSSKGAGWIISDVPLRTQVVVAGRRDGSAEEPAIEATGLSY